MLVHVCVKVRAGEKLRAGHGRISFVFEASTAPSPSTPPFIHVLWGTGRTAFRVVKVGLSVLISFWSAFIPSVFFLYEREKENCTGQ